MVDQGGLAERYRSHLAVLNERRFDDLRDFVQDALTYNGEPISRAQYSELIARDVAAVPDLNYDVRMLVTTEDQVAAVLAFDCTPVGEFLGFTPNGKGLVFTEHVFYRFHEGRIAAVWSLIDRDAITRQLAEPLAAT